MNDCIFCKIAKKTIPSIVVYEDDDMIIINDISPQSKKHYLLIPKKHYDNIIELATLDSTLLSRCMSTFASISNKLGIDNGFRVVTNVGEDGCQSVKHIHIHILGGEKLSNKMC